MIQITWVKCGNDSWCSLSAVNLTNVYTKGVYVIWKKDGSGQAVRIGQGDIAERLSMHRQDSKILRHGELNVTWGAVKETDRDGVERYLAEKYSPLEGDRFPNVTAIAVNLPSK